MGIDVVPATVINNIDKSTRLVVIDGDIVGPASRENIYIVPFGENSKSVVRSIDAFGIYKLQSSRNCAHNAKTSAWWRICDNTHCEIKHTSNGLELILHEPMPWVEPEVTDPEFWGISTLDIEHLLAQE